MKTVQYDFFANVTLEAHSSFYTFRVKKSHDFELQEVYKVTQQQPLRVNNVGSWSLNDGLQLTDVVKWERRKDLGGLEFAAASEHV